MKNRLYVGKNILPEGMMEIDGKIIFWNLEKKSEFY